MSDGAMSVEERIRAVEKILDRLLDWVGRVDNKASVVLGVNTAMLGALAGFAPPTSSWTLQLGVVTTISVAGVATSLLFVYLANYPRLKGPGESLTFFAAIAKKTFREYQKSFLALNSSDYLSDLLEQCHRNAEIVDRKFWALRWAYRALFFAVVPWVVSVYLFKLAGVCR